MEKIVSNRLFIAPHCDDCAISFGGTILAEGKSAVRMVAVNIFSRSSYTKAGLGDAATVTPLRQAEERRVMNAVGVETMFLDCPECPLRGYTISDPLDYPRFVLPELDEGLECELANRLTPVFAGFDEIIIPLAIGDFAHVDHRLARRAAGLVLGKNPEIRVRLYEDIPYIHLDLRHGLASCDWLRLVETPIDLDSKIRLIRKYESQPIQAWEPLIRAAAGRPPVERAWIVEDVSLLPLLESIKISDCP